MAHDWLDLTRRSSFASHRLIGWIYWDPRAIELYTQLGIPNGTGYYVASRAAPLLPAGHQAVAAAFYSIHPKFIEFAVTLAEQHASWSDIYAMRNQAVGEGIVKHRESTTHWCRHGWRSTAFVNGAAILTLRF